MKRVAVIDCGTNSVRLLVTDGMQDLERTLTITRLGEGVDRDRRLADAALARTVTAIAAYAERARTLGAQAIEVVATSAVRDAANSEEFVRAVEREAGLAPVVLSGEDEARAGFEGATADLDEGPSVIVDIGGGSTELIRGSAQVERWISMDLGSVRHTERHIHTDPPDGAEVASLRKDARAIVDDGVAAVGAEPAMLVGLAGTITTLAAISLELTRYDENLIHHAVLSRAAIERARATLCAMTTAHRRELPVMPRGREDVIVVGAVILEEIMDAFAAPSIVVSERDLLDGRAHRLLAGEPILGRDWE